MIICIIDFVNIRHQNVILGNSSFPHIKSYLSSIYEYGAKSQFLP